jgi:hypothetical protein
MRHRRRQPIPPIQPDLFSPPPTRPVWQSLPAQTRQQILPLLAKMLRSVSTDSASQTARMEVEDE